MAARGKTPSRRVRRVRPNDRAAAIVDAAIALAEETDWDRVRLRLVADRLGLPLAELQRHFRDLDAVADAWFRRAWAAMLAPPPADFDLLPARERLFIVLWRWFEALAPHRRVSVQMILGKIYLSHPHHWIPLIFNLSRTVHWLRDAAALDSIGRRRQAEEIGLTLLLLDALRVWARDESEGQVRTREHLRRRLASAERLVERLFAPRRSG